MSQRANGRFDDADPRPAEGYRADASALLSPLAAGLRRSPRPHAVACGSRRDRRRGQKQALNIAAIVHVPALRARHAGHHLPGRDATKSAADFYAAGGGITGFQNGLAIAGDYMSAASFLGISGLVFASGFDGLIYSIGFLVGWPIVLFLIAERLRNLGKFTFADVASFRLDQTQIRILSATGTLVVVAFYLIAQMVGAGKLIQLLFGLTTSMPSSSSAC